MVVLAALVVCERRGVGWSQATASSKELPAGTDRRTRSFSQLRRLGKILKCFIDKMSLESSIASFNDRQWKPRCFAGGKLNEREWWWFIIQHISYEAVDAVSVVR